MKEPTDNKKPKLGKAETPNLGKEKDEVHDWLAIVNKAEKWRDEIAQKAGWKRFIKEYGGDFGHVQSSVSIPLIPINYIFSYVKSKIAQMYFRDPWISVNAKRVEDLGSAQIAEQVLNYVWGELNLKREMKMCLLEALIVGHSWIKTGYVAEFGTVESRPVEKRGPGRPPKEEKIVDTNQYLKSESVFAYHVPWDHVVFDPSAQWPAMSNARWVAIKTVKPIRAIKESGIYENVDDLHEALTSTSKKMENSTVADAPGKESGTNEIKGAALWEIYDLDHMRVVTVSPGVEKYLRQIEYPEYLQGKLPLEMLYFNPLPGKAYPLSDIAAQEPQVIEMMKMNAIMMNHLKRFNRQMFIKPELMTNENKSNFKQGVDGAIIEVQAGSGPIESNFYIPPYPPIQQDIYGVWNINMDLYRNVSGQSDMERGGQARTQTRTLGELRNSMQGSKARSDESIDSLEDFIGAVARKILTIMQQKYDLPKLARIVGAQTLQKAMLMNRPSAQDPVTAQQAYTGESSFTWNKKDISGEMDVDVVAGSTVPLNKENQIALLEKLAPALGSLGIQPGSQAAREFGREFLRLIDIKSLERIMDIADEEAKTHPPQNPKLMEIQAKVQAKQQESQMKLQGIQAKTQADVVKSKLDIQKAQLDAQAQQHQLHLDAQKQKQELHHDILKNLLTGFRGQSHGGGEENGSQD